MSRMRLITMCLLFTATVALSGLENSATAQVKPFKISGGGVAEYLPFPGQPPAVHVAIGNATHLGRYHGAGMLQTDTLDFGTGAGTFSSAEPFVFTAANGDDLAFDYGRDDLNAAGPGTFQLYPVGGGEFIAEFIAEFNPNLALCTGRFEKVIGGSFMMTATTEPFVPGVSVDIAYTWDGQGTIEFRKGR